MDIFKQNKTLLIIIGIVVLLLGYYFMSSGIGSNSAPLVSTQAANGANSTEDRALLETLTNMRNIRLDGYLFESETFLSLQDFSRNIVPEAIGKENPFQPVQYSANSDTEINKEAEVLFR